MRSVILDTNVLISFVENEDAALTRLLSKFDEIVLTPTVLGEYRAGISDTKRGRESERALETLLESDSVREIGITSKTADYYAKVFRSLKAKGRPIPVNDIWIAASALENGLELCSFDKHFRAVEMVRLVTV